MPDFPFALVSNTPSAPAAPGSGAAGEATDALGLFAELLARLTGGAPLPQGQADASRSGEQSVQLAIETLFGVEALGLDFGAETGLSVTIPGEDAPVALADIAAAAKLDLSQLQSLEANADLSAAAERLFGELVGLMGTLGTALEAGETPDQALLEKIETTLDALAAVIELPLFTTPSPERLAAISDEQLSTGADLLGRLGGALGDLARLLLARDTGAPDAPAVDKRLAAVGARLEGFLSALAESEGGETLMARLGLTGGAPADPELAAGIETLLATREAAAKKPGPAQPSPAQPSPAQPSPAQTAAATPPPPAHDPRLVEILAARPAAPSAQPDDAETGEDDVRLAELGLRATDRAGADRPPASALPAPDPARAGVPAAPAPLAEAAGEPAVLQIVTETGARIETAPVARPVVAGYQTSQQQINLPQIAFEIARQVQHGVSQFQIRLDPPELGRIDVRLEIDKAGNTHARLTVERSETLDLMQRDQRALERALAQAGLDSDKTSLEFSLRQNTAGRQDRGGDGAERGNPGPEAGEEPAEAPPPTITLYRGALGAGALNILA